MSMITGCPACGTLFKVVPDQLKISDGWVRCGHCSEVFDAAAHMRQLVDEEAAEAAPDASMTMTAPLTADPPAPTSAPVPAISPAAAPAPAVVPFPSSAPKPDAPGPISVLPSYYPDDAIVVREVDSPSQLDGDSIAGPAYRLHRHVDEPPRADIDRREAQASRPRIELLDEEDGEDEGPRSIYDPSLDKVTFVRAARRKAFWRRPAVRLALVLVIFMLVAALGVQVAVHERDGLAAARPQWRPALQALCQAAGCTVRPQRRIEAIVIDSSGFTRVRQDAYKLSVTLKNLAPQPVAMPSLELTLTDAQDQPLLRKVLQARELGKAGDTLAATSDWSASATIAISSAADAARVAGYRLLAFYP